MGHVIAKRAMEMALTNARGMGMVAVQNSSHYGITGYYITWQRMQAGIGICGINMTVHCPPRRRERWAPILCLCYATDEEFHFSLD